MTKTLITGGVIMYEVILVPGLLQPHMLLVMAQHQSFSTIKPYFTKLAHTACWYCGLYFNSGAAAASGYKQGASSIPCIHSNMGIYNID